MSLKMEDVSPLYCSIANFWIFFWGGWIL